MKIGFFFPGGQMNPGLLSGNGVIDLTNAFSDLSLTNVRNWP
jgi:hypothetical protein